MPIRVFAQHKRVALHRRDCRQHRRRYHIVMKCVLNVKSRERSLSSSVCVRRNACSVREMLSAHKKMPNYDSLSQRHAHRPTDRPAIHPIHVYMRHHIHTHGRHLACVWARLSFACRGSARLESNLDIELSFSNVLVVVESTYRT